MSLCESAVRASLIPTSRYFRYCPEDLKPKLAKAILKFAAEYGVDVESPTVLSYAGE